MWTLVAQFGVSLIVAFVSAYITVRLALNRFRQEQWWGKKYEAYAGLLSALHKIKKSFSDDFDLWVLQREPSQEQKEINQKLYADGMAEIAQYSDLADFLLSEESYEVLKDFGRSISHQIHNSDHQDFLEQSAAVADRALTALKPAAKRDLSLSERKG